MWKRFWSFLTGDTVDPIADLYSTSDGFERYIYSPELLNQINENRRYKILANRSQTQIYILDSQYNQKVARCYDISYALLLADSLNQDL